MNQADEVLDLDYDSPLELLFWFLGSFWCMGVVTLFVWFMAISPGKNGRPPIWADFPIVPFAMGMACVWAVGYWLKGNYDVRYQLDSRTQQLNLVRKIFGTVFKSRVADLSQLHSAGVMSSYSDDKNGRHWSYAQCLVANSGRIIRVSSFVPEPPQAEAEKLAITLGIPSIACQLKATLVARPDGAGGVTVNYQEPPSSGQVSSTFVVIVLVIVLAVFGGVFLASMH